MTAQTNGSSNSDKDMRPHRCVVCGFIYGPEVGDPESNITPGQAFEDLPEGYLCPLCGAGKSLFMAVED